MTSKVLVAGGIRHAFYEIEGDVVYIKIIPSEGYKRAEHLNLVGLYEDMLLQHINELEGTQIEKLGYLNESEDRSDG